MANNVIGQTATAYAFSGGAYMEPKALQQHDTKQMRIIHTVPNMSETERENVKKRIGNDLYVVFLRIQEYLKIESEL